MKKTENLERLCQEIYEYPPDFDKIVKRFKSHPDYNENHAFYLENYLKFFSELHLHISLEDIQNKVPGINILLNPSFESNGITDKYKFKYNFNRNLFVYILYENKYPIQEYDKLIKLFENNNGIAIPFYTNRNSFKKDVIEVVIENKLKLK